MASIDNQRFLHAQAPNEESEASKGQPLRRIGARFRVEYEHRRRTLPVLLRTREVFGVFQVWVHPQGKL